MLGLVGAMMMAGGAGAYLAFVTSPYGWDEPAHVGYVVSVRRGHPPDVDTPIPDRGRSPELEPRAIQARPYWTTCRAGRACRRPLAGQPANVLRCRNHRHDVTPSRLRPTRAAAMAAIGCPRIDGIDPDEVACDQAGRRQLGWRWPETRYWAPTGTRRRVESTRSPAVPSTGRKMT